MFAKTTSTLFRSAARQTRKVTPFQVRFLSAEAGAEAAQEKKQIPRKVAVVGAAGGIGQPLSLLLKLNENISDLALYDVAPVTPGVAVDLSHIDTSSKVTGHTGDDLAKCLEGCDIVVVPAGVPRKPGMTRDDLFNINAGIVANVAKTVAQTCPNALLLIISNPVNSTVPVAATIMEQEGAYDKRKLMGVTTLDMCRADTFVSQAKGLDVLDVQTPVIGGHAGKTILPLLSMVEANNEVSFSDEEREKLTHRVMFGGDEVVQAKAGGGSATLSMAHAAASMTEDALRAMNGEEDIDICTYVDSEVGPTRFFSSWVRLGAEGVKNIYELDEMNAFEKQKLEEMVPELNSSIEKGIEFAKSYGK